MFGNIDLAHWRWIALGLRKELRWVYVGSDHNQPGNVWAYANRHRLLEANEFQYWPDSSCKGGGLKHRLQVSSMSGRRLASTCLTAVCEKSCAILDVVCSRPTLPRYHRTC